jgi:hypothetical protein
MPASRIELRAQPAVSQHAEGVTLHDSWFLDRIATVTGR